MIVFGDDGGAGGAGGGAGGGCGGHRGILLLLLLLFTPPCSCTFLSASSAASASASAAAAAAVCASHRGCGRAVFQSGSIIIQHLIVSLMVVTIGCPFPLSQISATTDSSAYIPMHCTQAECKQEGLNLIRNLTSLQGAMVVYRYCASSPHCPFVCRPDLIPRVTSSSSYCTFAIVTSRIESFSPTWITCFSGPAFHTQYSLGFDSMYTDHFMDGKKFW